jgi:hypothetical protein
MVTSKVGCTGPWMPLDSPMCNNVLDTQNLMETYRYFEQFETTKLKIITIFHCISEKPLLKQMHVGVMSHVSLQFILHLWSTERPTIKGSLEHCFICIIRPRW